ncbi:MAG: hypothetical protein LBG65_05720 [Puniceicoccales bacterium]|nr:hypothetical protein [Puniceicoccales bacterium]
MKSTPDRFAGAFAVFFAAIFPFICGNTVRLCHGFLVDIIAQRRTEAGVVASRELPALPGIALNHLQELFWGLFVVTFVFVLLAVLQCRVADAAVRLSRQFVIAFASALVGLAFLVFYLLACIHAAPVPAF